MSTYSCAQQDTATQELSLSRTRESELEEKVKLLEETRSDLEAEVEKQMKQLEILSSDIEQLAKVHIDVVCSCVCVCVCVYMCVCVCVLFLCVCVHVHVCKNASMRVYPPFHMRTVKPFRIRM